MSKVVLSTGYEFELIPNGYGASSEEVHFSVVSDDRTLEELEQIFSGIEEFKVVVGEDMEDPAVIANYFGYTRVSTLTKIPEYYIGVDQETGEAIYSAVSTITCIKRAIEDRMKDAEESIDDIIMSILGGDESITDLGGEETTPVEG